MDVQMKRGLLDVCVLSAIKNEDSYGYKIIKDVSWFAKQFDYRYDSEPWYDSRDAVERAIKLLSGK